MKIIVSIALLLDFSTAFVPSFPTRGSMSATMTATEIETEESEVSAKESLLDLAKSLKEEYGAFLVDSAAKKELSEAVEALEASTTVEYDEDMLLGDWDLVLTTSSSIEGIDTSQFPGPIKQIRDRIRQTTNKYLKVQQKIKAVNGTLDRIDHVLTSQPPKELSDLVDNLPDAIKNLNTNPLDVSTSKLVLIHKASVESETPLTTKLSLKSIVWNVAGKSTYLDPEGKDIAGINLPWGEFLNTGSFETTYVDQELRVIRGKQGFVDLMRIFVKSEPEVEIMEDVAAVEPETEVIDAEFTNNDAPSDVEEVEEE